MANIIDTVAIKIDADTSLFDKKLKQIKTELKKIQKINVDMQKSGGGKGGGSLLAAGALGALGANVLGGRGGGSGTFAMPKPPKMPKMPIPKIPSPEPVNDLTKAFDKLSQSMKNIPQITLDLTGDEKKDIGEFNIELEKQAQGWRNVAEEARQARIVIKNMLKQKFVKGDLRNSLKNIQTGLRDDKFSTIKPYSGKDPFGEGTKKVKLQTWRLLEKQIKDLEARFDKAKYASERFSRALAAVGAAAKKAGAKLSSSFKAGFLPALSKMNVAGGKFVTGLANGIAGGFAKAFKIIRNVALVAFGAIAVLAKKGFEEGMIDKRAFANLDAAIASTGTKIGLTKDQIAGMVNELDKETNFGKAELANGAAILATFTNIKGDKFKEVLNTATDLSAAFGQDLKSSVVQLGKALNDPIKGVTALSRVGVSFTEQEKKKIKALVEENKILEAQNLIINSMKTQGISGQAKAMTDSVAQTKKGFEDFRKEIATSVIKFFNLKSVFEQGRGWFDALNIKLKAFTSSKEFATWSAYTIYYIKVVLAWIQNLANSLHRLTVLFGAELRSMLRGLKTFVDTMGDWFAYTFGGDEGLNEFIAKKNRLQAELNKTLANPPVLGDIDVKGIIPNLMEETEDLGDTADKTKDKFEELKRTMSQGSGATSIFDSVLEGMNTLIGGSGTLKMLELSKSFPKIAGYFKKAGDAQAGIGDVNASTATGTSSQTSMSTMIVDAIKSQTDILVNSLTQINNSVKGISAVI